MVAEEVRNLAKRSSDAANQSSGIIDACVTHGGNSMEISLMLEEKLYSIQEKTNAMNSMLNQVFDSTEQERTGIEQINAAVAELDRFTQNTAARAEESAGASYDLMQQTVAMRTNVQDLAGIVHGTDSIEAQEMEAHVETPWDPMARNDELEKQNSKFMSIAD